MPAPLTLHQRFALFLAGCIGVRLGVAYLAATAPPDHLRILGVLGGVIALGFTTIFVAKLRPTGTETGGQPIWWDCTRPLHAFMYAVFAYHAWVGDSRMASLTLLADVIIGLANFVGHHFF